MNKIVALMIIVASPLIYASDEQLFTSIYSQQVWKAKESISGPGSDIDSTIQIRNELPKLLRGFGIKTMIDAPCGDFWWMQLTDISMLDSYLGIDIVKPLIAENASKYRDQKIDFCHMDVTQSIVPKVDLIMCRDLFLHIPSKMIAQVIRKFKASGSTYLLATTYRNCNFNIERKSANYTFRPINLEIEPFNLPEPIIYIFEKKEDRLEWYRYLALWKLEDIEV